MFPHKSVVPYLKPDGELDMDNEVVKRMLSKFSHQLGEKSLMIERVIARAEDIVAHGIVWEETEARWLESRRSVPLQAEHKKGIGNPDSDYARYIQACQDRKKKIEEAQAAWKKAVADAETAKFEWTNYVRRMRQEYEAIRTSPAPVRDV